MALAVENMLGSPWAVSALPSLLSALEPAMVVQFWFCHLLAVQAWASDTIFFVFRFPYLLCGEEWFQHGKVAMTVEGGDDMKHWVWFGCGV